MCCRKPPPTGSTNSTCAASSTFAMPSRWCRRCCSTCRSATGRWPMDEVIDIQGFGYGILTPATAQVAPVTLVLLNAGLTHRVGPFRGYVGIARYLAPRGGDVFRLDLPLLGEGPSPGTSRRVTVAAPCDTLCRVAVSLCFLLAVFSLIDHTDSSIRRKNY